MTEEISLDFPDQNRITCTSLHQALSLVHGSCGSQSVVTRAAAAITAIDLLEMQVVGPLPSPTDLEILGLRSNDMLLQALR